MPKIKLRSVAGGIASVAVAMSLAACVTEGALVSNIQKDGSVEFVATNQVSDVTSQGGISVDKGQDIVIDLNGIKKGTMHVEIATEDEDLGKDATPQEITDSITPDPDDVVFSQTLSAEDIPSHKGGIISVEGIDEGYYAINVSADHATGKIVVSTIDV